MPQEQMLWEADCIIYTIPDHDSISSKALIFTLLSCVYVWQSLEVLLSYTIQFVKFVFIIYV